MYKYTLENPYYSVNPAKVPSLENFTIENVGMIFQSEPLEKIPDVYGVKLLNRVLSLGIAVQEIVIGANGCTEQITPLRDHLGKTCISAFVFWFPELGYQAIVPSMLYAENPEICLTNKICKTLKFELREIHRRIADQSNFFSFKEDEIQYDSIYTVSLYVQKSVS